MAKIDSDAEKVFNDWLDFLIPEEMTVKELEKIAKKSKLSYEALRKLKNRSRRGMSTETLIRLAIARGISANALISALIKADQQKNCDQSEIDWINFGRNLSPKKRVDFLEFIKYMRSLWKI